MSSRGFVRLPQSALKNVAACSGVRGIFHDHSRGSRPPGEVQFYAAAPENYAAAHQIWLISIGLSGNTLDFMPNSGLYMHLAKALWKAFDRVVPLRYRGHLLKWHRQDGMEVPSGDRVATGRNTMKKSLLLGVALATLALCAPASAELKFKPGEDPKIPLGGFRRAQEGRPEGRDADDLRTVARRG